MHTYKGYGNKTKDNEYRQIHLHTFYIKVYKTFQKTLSFFCNGQEQHFKFQNVVCKKSCGSVLLILQMNDTFSGVPLEKQGAQDCAQMTSCFW